MVLALVLILVALALGGVGLLVTGFKWLLIVGMISGALNRDAR